MKELDIVKLKDSRVVAILELYDDNTVLVEDKENNLFDISLDEVVEVIQAF